MSTEKIHLAFNYFNEEGCEKKLVSVKADLQIAINFAIRIFRDRTICSVKLVLLGTAGNKHIELEPDSQMLKGIRSNLLSDFYFLCNTENPTHEDACKYKKVAEGVWMTRYHPTLQGGTSCAYLKGFCGMPECRGIKLSSRSVHHFLRLSSVMTTVLNQGNFDAL